MYQIKIQSSQINQAIQYNVEDPNKELEELQKGKIIWITNQKQGFFINQSNMSLITFTFIEPATPPTEEPGIVVSEDAKYIASPIPPDQVVLK